MLNNLLKKAQGFFDESGLGLTDEEKVEIKTKGDHNGLAIYEKNAKKEHDKMFNDIKKELDAMLKAKHLY